MSNRLKQFREGLGWSQARMAIELGTNQPTVWRIENDQQQPSKSIEKLIDVLMIRYGKGVELTGQEARKGAD